MNLTTLTQNFNFKKVTDRVPEAMRNTAFLRLFGLAKVPMIFFCSPRVVELSSQRCEIVIPLSRRTKNHLRSMYFGALCVGADCAGGMIGMKIIEEEKVPVNLVFKDFKAEFLKRPEGDVHFSCENGVEIVAAVKRAMETGERQNVSVPVVATVPTKLGSEPVATFVLTLSLKKKK